MKLLCNFEATVLFHRLFSLTRFTHHRVLLLLLQNGTIQGLKYIWRTEGFKGMFKGNGTNCAPIVPNSAVKFFYI
ncbi:putative mitochondrial carrier domain protein [Helianthus annuus]|nr:putative mitochondrial carrier domain protein [Helianthus annuus]